MELAPLELQSFRPMPTITHFTMRKFKLIAVAFLIVFLVFSIWLNIVTVSDGRALSKILGERGVVILSKSETDILLSDLESADKDRLHQWRMYLYEAAGCDTNVEVISGGLDQAFALYQAKERPGRSNYYNILVCDLWIKQQASPLSKQTVIRFLGSPDATIPRADRQLLQYVYECGGRDWQFAVAISNDIVLSADISVK
jgi:hypothetical protein